MERLWNILVAEDLLTVPIAYSYTICVADAIKLGWIPKAFS